MLKKSITYTDFEGNERTEEFYFNLTKSEIIEMEMSEVGGMSKMLERIVAEQNGKEIIATFKMLIGKSYGEKSPDGKRFIKNQELTDAFMQTGAYDELFMELVSDTDKATEFINGIIPKV